MTISPYALGQDASYYGIIVKPSFSPYLAFRQILLNICALHEIFWPSIAAVTASAQHAHL
jgi:hypothetical protein